MRVCVIGLGYVGAVTAVCLARDGHSVLGIDLDPVKLDLLRRGQPPIIEEGLHEVTRVAAESGRLEVADRVDERIAACDLIFVCVGTPSAPNGSQNLAAVERVAEQFRHGGQSVAAGGGGVGVDRHGVHPWFALIGLMDCILVSSKIGRNLSGDKRHVLGDRLTFSMSLT